MRLLFLFLFCAVTVAGQEVDFEGFIKDVDTKEPIPFVNISFLNTLVGTSTDEEGHFLLTIPEPVLQKQVHISSLGYKDTIVAAKTIFLKKGFYIKAEAMALDEVVLAEDFGNSKVLNPISSYSITSGFDASSTPWILALYFPNIGAAKKYLEKVTIFFRDKNEFTRDRAKFRLRFFGVDPVTKEPTVDLTRKSLVLEAVKGKEYTSIDIAAMKLKMPKEGVYVGLEWLFIPYNWYKKDDKDNITSKPRIEDRFAPTFGGVYTKNGNYKVYVYGMGAWRPFDVKARGNNQHFIPAVSLKIGQKL